MAVVVCALAASAGCAGEGSPGPAAAESSRQSPTPARAATPSAGTEELDVDARLGCSAVALALAAARDPALSAEQQATEFLKHVDDAVDSLIDSANATARRAAADLASPDPGVKVQAASDYDAFCKANGVDFGATG
jgi:predicted 2-oxoglutarate/Fe(II)-dependent dioxygenase YbiX